MKTCCTRHLRQPAVNANWFTDRPPRVSQLLTVLSWSGGLSGAVKYPRVHQWELSGGNVLQSHAIRHSSAQFVFLSMPSCWTIVRLNNSTETDKYFASLSSDTIVSGTNYRPLIFIVIEMLNKIAPQQGSREPGSPMPCHNWHRLTS